MRKACLIAWMMLLWLPALSSAAIINAASCSYSDMSAAVNSAQSGDTVLVPAGTCTWDSRLSIITGIVLKGAGIGNTIIHNEYKAPNTYSTDRANSLIYFSAGIPTSNQVFRLSGFTFILNNNSGWIHLRTTASGVAALRNLRIDHNRVVGTSGVDPSFRMIYVWGHIYGVIDNNEFHDIKSTLGAYSLNKETWSYFSFDFGSADNIYFEDNVLTNLRGMPHSGGAGGRYCARYNSYTAHDTGYYQLFDMHGNQGPGTNLATMGAEGYNNVFTRTAGTRFSTRLFDQRAGKGIFFNNIINTDGSTYATFREEYIDNSTPPAFNLISGQPQHISESYSWNNTKNGVTRINPYVSQTVDYAVGQTFDGITYPSASPYRIVPQLDLDCFRQVDSFDGSSGVGVGLLSDRPVSCSLEGAAWWASDEQRFYRWKSGAWELYYVPYTYPHPLRTDCVSYPLLCDSGSSPPPTVHGDLNGDGLVNSDDFFIVVSDFGKTSGFNNPESDTNNDGVIDIYDVVYVASRMI